MWKRIPNKREIISWCFFDFANSSFTTLIVTIAFSVYLVKIVVGGGREGDQLWGLGNAISQGMVLLSAPLLGAIADYSARKKTFLFLSYITCVIFTALLYFAKPGEVWIALMLFIIGNFAYSTGENLIASFLPEIARPEDMGKISGFGWGLGYIGGLLCLLCCFPFLKGGFVLENAEHLRKVNLVVAAFFLTAGIPTFLWVHERKKASSLPEGTNYFSAGIAQIKQTFVHIQQYRELFKFLIIFGIYNCGVTTVVYFASIYASETIGLSAIELIWFFIITQISSSLGAILFGVIQDKIGAKNTIYITLTIWLGVVIGAYFATGRTAFYIVGNLAGLGLGSSQSAARALVGMFSPVEKSGEFFGFWGLFWKLSTAIGPATFGILSNLTGSQRTAIISTGIFFLIGIIGITFVNEKRGIEAARSFSGVKVPSSL
ncbi:MFS transporter [bacterium]|nr:MFS transporter [bacterium]